MGIRNFKPTLRKAAERLATVHTPEVMPLPPNALAELQRDMTRLGFVVSQIREIEEARQKRLEQQPETGPHAMVRRLARIVGVGVETADMLVHELLSRPMRDRRAVARGACPRAGQGPDPGAGLTGSPDESVARRREQGLARAGNARVPHGSCVDGPRLACRQLKVACGHVSGLWSRPVAAGPDGFRGIEALIKPAGSRCPMTRDRYPSTRQLTDDAITRFHPRKSWWFKVQFLCSISEPFLRPDLISARRRAQPRSRLAAGHRRRRRAAVLTAVSTASGSGQVGARLILPWPAIGLLAHHHRPTDARHLVGERAGGELALLGCEQFDQPGILLGSLAAQHRHGAVDEQSAQVTVAALADRTQFDRGLRRGRLFPPVPSCRGTRPSEAEKCRPLPKAAGSTAIAAMALDRIGP